MSRVAHDANWPGYVRTSIGVFPKVHRRLLRLIAEKLFRCHYENPKDIACLSYLADAFLEVFREEFIQILELVGTEGTVSAVRALSASFVSGHDELDCLALVEHVVHGIS